MTGVIPPDRLTDDGRLTDAGHQSSDEHAGGCLLLVQVGLQQGDRLVPGSSSVLLPLGGLVRADLDPVEDPLVVSLVLDQLVQLPAQLG